MRAVQLVLPLHPVPTNPNPKVHHADEAQGWLHTRQINQRSSTNDGSQSLLLPLAVTKKAADCDGLSERWSIVTPLENYLNHPPRNPPTHSLVRLPAVLSYTAAVARFLRAPPSSGAGKRSWRGWSVPEPRAVQRCPSSTKPRSPMNHNHPPFRWGQPTLELAFSANKSPQRSQAP